MAYTLSRRQFISRLFALAACSAFNPAYALSLTDSIVSPFALPLREHAARKGLLFGSAASKGGLLYDQKYASGFGEQCSILVPESELKWGALRPTPDTYNFADADWLYQFSKRRNMKFRGHTFVWRLALPDWFKDYATKQNAEKLLSEHITKVATRYAGGVHSWDVVNEVIAQPWEHDAEGLTDSPWRSLLGPDYIDLAFHTAAKADPNAMLVWNEDNLEGEHQPAVQKRAFFLQHLEKRLKRGVPVHAIGIQSHLHADNNTLGGPKFMQFVRTISDMGLKILITELDVRDSLLPGDTEIRDKLVAECYSRYLSAILQEKAVIAVLTWGLSNPHSWLTYDKPRQDGFTARPLPFDESMKPTPTWFAMAKAFDDATTR